MHNQLPIAYITITQNIINRYVCTIAAVGREKGISYAQYYGHIS